MSSNTGRGTSWADPNRNIRFGNTRAASKADRAAVAAPDRHPAGNTSRGGTGRGTGQQGKTR